MMRKILILGGFAQMVDVVLTANKMGLYTIVVDRDQNSPAKKYSHKSLNCSTDDIAQLKEICKQERIDGIFTSFEDFNIHIAYKICKDLKLPFYSDKTQLEIATDKSKFIKLCKKFDIPVIEQVSFKQAINHSKFPYIVKPSDSYGSRGISVCHNEEELIKAIPKAQASSLTKNVVIERFIQSDYGVELFYTIVNKNIYLTSTADRYTVQAHGSTVPLPIAEVFPSKHHRQIVNELDAKFRLMFDNLRITNGVILIQAMYKNDCFYIYEMAYRLTGEQHYQLVQKQQGFNLVEMMIKLAMGDSINEFDTEYLSEKYFKHPAINLSVLLNPGKISEIKGMDLVKEVEGVISFILVHKVNDEIRSNGDYSRILMRINLIADDFNKLRHSISAVNDYIYVLSELKQNMLMTKFILSEEY